MDEIRPWLYIGGYRDTQNKSYLDYKGIRSMLQLASPIKLPGISSLFLPVEDVGETPPELIRRGVDYILEEKNAGNTILVACGAGINRSTSFCMAALKETENLSLLDAFKEVKRKHRDAMPHEPVWDSFCMYYNESTPYLEIMRISAQLSNL